MKKNILYMGIVFILSVTIMGCGMEEQKVQEIVPEQGNSQILQDDKGNSSVEQSTVEEKDEYVSQMQEEDISDSSGKVNVSSMGDQSDLLDAIKATYEFPFRLWKPEGMELFCVYIYEDHAKREWCSDCEQTCYDDLSWDISGNYLNISGTWTESFVVDLENKTATSVESGMVYSIVEGYGW